MTQGPWKLQGPWASSGTQTLPGQGCQELCAGRAQGPVSDPGEAQPGPPPPGPAHTSSIRIRGFSVLVFFRHWMIFPGMAPTYVRLGEGPAGRSEPRWPEAATPHPRPSCLGAPGPQCVPHALPSRPGEAAGKCATWHSGGRITAGGCHPRRSTEHSLIPTPSPQLGLRAGDTDSQPGLTQTCRPHPSPDLTSRP